MEVHGWCRESNLEKAEFPEPFEPNEPIVLNFLHTLIALRGAESAYLEPNPLNHLNSLHPLNHG